MKENKDNNNDNIHESIEGENLEELWELLLGKEGLEKRKAKYEVLKLKEDYRLEDINIIDCPMCGCDEVPNTDINIELKLSGTLFKVSTFRGAKCRKCNEMYFNSTTTDSILRLAKVFDELFPEQNHSEVK